MAINKRATRQQVGDLSIGTFFHTSGLLFQYVGDGIVDCVSGSRWRDNSFYPEIMVWTTILCKCCQDNIATGIYDHYCCHHC